jgi:NOL1/NOP2/sun family putative RNA methylase
MEKIEEFKKHLAKYMPQKDIDELMVSLEKKPIKGLYINTNKVNSNEILNAFPFLKPNPVVNNAFYYEEENKISNSPLYILGGFYMQEPSSAIAVSLLDIKNDELVLDMCAAPGGKAIEASLKCKNGVVIANDSSLSRANIIIENAERMGIDNMIITNTDLSLPNSINGLKNVFDHIILDAPCSGSGMFRKENKMFDDWSIEKVLLCAKKQKLLIMNAYKMLKPGGTMSYSTCSYSYEEDEEIIRYLLANSNAILIDIYNSPFFYRSDLKETIHIFPSKFSGEGQYIAIIKKPGVPIKNSWKNVEEAKHLNSEFKKIIANRNNIEINDTMYSLNRKLDIDGLYIIRYGVKIYTLKNGILRPEHHYSRFINNNKSYELTDSQYLNYIKGYELKLPNIKDGWNIVAYKGLNAGFVKAKNCICKNHYPKGLRIK